MAITPDTKDWTWVLDAPCGECGFDTRTVDPGEVAGILRSNAAAWPHLLEADNARQRPKPDVWSTLEYACHVRDVFRLYDRRLRLMLDQDDPAFENWDQDATAVADGYAGQDPTTVAAGLTAAAGPLAARFDSVEGDAWRRTGRRSDGATFTVATFARYLVHDSVHHLWDVTHT